MTADLLHELRNNHNDFPTYLHDLAARAAYEIERLNALHSAPPSDFGKALTEYADASFDCGAYQFRTEEDPAEKYDVILGRAQSAREKLESMYSRQHDNTPGDDAIDS